MRAVLSVEGCCGHYRAALFVTLDTHEQIHFVTTAKSPLVAYRTVMDMLERVPVPDLTPDQVTLKTWPRGSPSPKTP